MTIGITPNAPANWLRIHRKLPMKSKIGQKPSKSFCGQSLRRKKPNLETAQSYVDSGKILLECRNFFVFKVFCFSWKQFRKYAPSFYTADLQKNRGKPSETASYEQILDKNLQTRVRFNFQLTMASWKKRITFFLVQGDFCLERPRKLGGSFISTISEKTKNQNTGTGEVIFSGYQKTHTFLCSGQFSLLLLGWDDVIVVKGRAIPFLVLQARSWPKKIKRCGRRKSPDEKLDQYL